ncbi:Uncharacterized protein QTN25_002128 [Entamoeba marina]
MEKNPKAPQHADSEKKRKSRSNFVLHSNALLYLLLKKGWTIKLRKAKTAKLTTQSYKCVELVKKGLMIEEEINEDVLADLSACFEELAKSKEKDDNKNVVLEQCDIIPNENSSETVSEDAK